MVPALAFPCRRWVAACAVVIGSLAGGGCASTEPPPPALAHMAVENLTSYAWRIVLTADQGGPPQVLSIEPHDSRTIDVPAGKYHVEQSIVSAAAAGIPSRRFDSQLEPGETYRWPLMTLLSP